MIITIDTLRFGLDRTPCYIPKVLKRRKQFDLRKIDFDYLYNIIEKELHWRYKNAGAHVTKKFIKRSILRDIGWIAFYVNYRFDGTFASYKSLKGLYYTGNPMYASNTHYSKAKARLAVNKVIADLNKQYPTKKQPTNA